MWEFPETEDLPVIERLVAHIRQIVNQSAPLAAMLGEWDREEQVAVTREHSRLATLEARRRNLRMLVEYGVQTESGVHLATVLNQLFLASNVPLLEPLTVQISGDQGSAVRLNGVADAKGVCFIEVRCGTHLVGQTELEPYLARLAQRDPRERGLYIASEDYTAAGIALCKMEILRGRIVVLCRMREIYDPWSALLDLKHCIDDKIGEATVNREPWFDTDRRNFRSE
jgi:hypothetical protein